MFLLKWSQGFWNIISSLNIIVVQNFVENISLKWLPVHGTPQTKGKDPQVEQRCDGHPATEPAPRLLRPQFPPIFSLSMPHYNTLNDQAITKLFACESRGGDHNTRYEYYNGLQLENDILRKNSQIWRLLSSKNFNRRENGLTSKRE